MKGIIAILIVFALIGLGSIANRLDTIIQLLEVAG